MAIPRTTVSAFLGRLLNPANMLRFAALLLLLAQLGIVAHRIEHYIAPEHMECGEDACVAFAPTPASAEPALFVPLLVFIAFYVCFWSVRAAAVRPAGIALGFRAHAPPI